VLSRPDDDVADLLALVAEICDASASGITVLYGEEFHIPATFGTSPFVSPAAETFCRETMHVDGLFCVEDAATDPRFATIGWVDGRFARARFYASAPLHAPDGQIIGRLCVIDPQPKVLTALQRRTLETLALSASQLLEIRLAHESRVTPQDGTGQAAATVMAQLAAELSHDLRVPLSSIVASVEMLEEELAGHPDRAVTALLGRTTRAADRMVRMLESNMDFGALDEAAHRVKVDLGQVVQQLVLDSAALLEPVGAIVEARDLPVVRAHPGEMYSVLQNLVTNSVKFARDDVPTWVRISARRIDAGWRVSVRDNGVGIPEDRRVDVFSLFSRVEGHVAGHGIGLATVARIITAHGGRAGAAPVAGSGTEIWFELPDVGPDVPDPRRPWGVGGP
jgi:signal transduction histidine kinase